MVPCEVLLYKVLGKCRAQLVISIWQSVFCHVLGQFPVVRVCSATSQVDFWSAECVPLRPGWISGQQRVFRHVLGRFPVGRVCSAASLVVFRSADCVPPHPGSIYSRQSVFCHVPGQFPVGRVCSAESLVVFRWGSDPFELFQGTKHRFFPFFPKMRY